MTAESQVFERAGIRDIAGRVLASERVSAGDGARLFRCRDLPALGMLADAVRRRMNDDRATYIRNRYINYSNICILDCQFCAFARRRREPGAWEYTLPEMVELARKAAREGVTELHIVGGLHPTLPFDYYLGMMRELRVAAPGVHLKAFTAIEIRHMAERVAKRPIPEVLEALRDAGLGSLTGGGAEIFDAGVRDRICRGKETAEEWLGVHREWHRMGGRSTCTMLYGHVEMAEHRADHLCRLRALQDETGGFTGFIPLPFQPEDNELAHVRRCSGFEDLRAIAVSRIMLDNVRHVTAYWVGLGLPMAQVALGFGADDLHGTIMEEHIFHMAGADSPQAVTVSLLERVIREAGKVPFERDSHYGVLSEGRATAVA
ncbi:MAG TPA: aminofutalosine synthase MqnE [Verrucomicrobiae bacterium]|nr:aminofutalosine synthase MqnE [Verrucomicrobiae bacterium]